MHQRECSGRSGSDSPKPAHPLIRCCRRRLGRRKVSDHPHLSLLLPVYFQPAVWPCACRSRSLACASTQCGCGNAANCAEWSGEQMTLLLKGETRPLPPERSRCTVRRIQSALHVRNPCEFQCQRGACDSRDLRGSTPGASLSPRFRTFRRTCRRKDA